LQCASLCRRANPAARFAREKGGPKPALYLNTIRLRRRFGLLIERSKRVVAELVVGRRGVLFKMGDL